MRDRVCRFPGCTNHRFTDGHHVKHWAEGGETALDNLVTLCRYHHRLVHEGGFGCARDASGAFVFTAPDRRRLRDDLPVPPVEEDPYAWFARELAAQDIGPDTCIADFNDPHIDWNLAVAPLVPSRFA